ncbi:MAG: TetR/AcrR family transcriptional regulator [Nakamurella sp.]
MTETARPATRLSRSDRRVQLLTAARSVFSDQGYHASSMDDIAEAAGVSKPVLYQHFSSKLQLYVALLEISADEMVGRVRSALAAAEDNKERVRGTIRAYFDFVADNQQAYRLIFESDLHSEIEVQTLVDRATEGCVQALTETIMKNTGEDQSHSRLLAAGLVGLSHVSARFWISEQTPIERDVAIELLSTLAWRGISRFPQS